MVQSHFGRLIKAPLCGCFVRNSFTKLQTPVKRLSTATVSESTNYSMPVKMCNPDATKHTMDDFLKYYSIDKKFIQGSLNNDIPKQFSNFSKSLGEYNFMLRKPSLQIIQELEDNDQFKQKKFLLHGPKGSGKSLSLLHILHYASIKDWQILYVPDGYRFIDSQGSTEVQPSQWRPGRLDQPKESLLWLSNFRQLNNRFLQQAQTTAEYKWGKRESTEKGCPLINVVDQGIGRSLYAADAVGVVLKELRSDPELKVLLAIDRFNGIFNSSSHKLDGKMVESSNLSLVHHFTKLMKPEFSLGENSVYVLALSQTGQYVAPIRDSDDILHNLYDKAPEVLDFTKVEIPNYSESEYEMIINLYKSKGWISRDLTSKLSRELEFVTGRNPLSVMKYTSLL